MKNVQNDDEDQISIGKEEEDTNNELENLNAIKLLVKNNYRNNYQLQKENANNINDEKENNGNNASDEWANNGEYKINDESENRNENVFDLQISSPLRTELWRRL